MDKVPNDIDIDNIKTSIENKFSEINEIHHIHIWSVDGINNYMTAHIVLNKDISKEKIINLKKDIKSYLNTVNISHSTLEIEYNSELCDSKHC